MCVCICIYVCGYIHTQTSFYTYKRTYIGHAPNVLCKCKGLVYVHQPYCFPELLVSSRLSVTKHRNNWLIAYSGCEYGVHEKKGGNGSICLHARLAELVTFAKLLTWASQLQ